MAYSHLNLSATIDGTGSVANHTIVAAVTGKQIVVQALWTACSGIIAGYFRSATDGAELLAGADWPITTGAAAVPYIQLPYNENGWFATDAGEALVWVQTVGTTDVSGVVAYTLV